MLEAFNPEVHTLLNQIGCSADFVQQLVYWSYGANDLSYGRYVQIADSVKKMQKALLALEALEKRFNDVV